MGTTRGRHKYDMGLAADGTGTARGNAADHHQAETSCREGSQSFLFESYLIYWPHVLCFRIVANSYHAQTHKKLDKY